MDRRHRATVEGMGQSRAPRRHNSRFRCNVAYRPPGALFRAGDALSCSGFSLDFMDFSIVSLPFLLRSACLDRPTPPSPRSIPGGCVLLSYQLPQLQRLVFWEIGSGLARHLGFGGGGGTFLNIGHDPAQSWLAGWSLSVTGTAGGGAVAGVANVGISFSVSNARDVSALLGTFYKAGRGGLGRTGVGYFQSPGGAVKRHL